MNVLPHVTNSYRMEGCTILGALSVTTSISDCVTIVHGPSGCAHHNFSLFHATNFGSDGVSIPHILSSKLTQDDVIFGGENALETTIQEAMKLDPGSVCVLNTCIADTIGDDTAAICRKKWRVPVFFLPSSGFLGGGFTRGLINALIALSERTQPGVKFEKMVNLIGEKNLEFEVEENFSEIRRLLHLLDLSVNLRFIRNIPTADLFTLSSGECNILREHSLFKVGNTLQWRFNQPFIDQFPIGFHGTLEFLREMSHLFGVDGNGVIENEQHTQMGIIDKFCDVHGVSASFGPERHPPSQFPPIEDLVERLGLRYHVDGIGLPVPTPLPVGTLGMSRLLRIWRKVIDAAL